MMPCEEAMTRNLDLALRLLNDDRAPVRAWTAFLLVGTDRYRPDARVVDKVKSVALDDPDPRVRHVALKVFDDPLESTIPHLELTADQALDLFGESDPLCRELLLHPVGKGRCHVGDADQASFEILLQGCLEELRSDLPERRWPAYRALRRLCRDDRLAEREMRGAFPGVDYFEGLAMRFWMTAPEEARRSAVRAILQGLITPR